MYKILLISLRHIISGKDRILFFYEFGANKTQKTEFTFNYHTHHHPILMGALEEPSKAAIWQGGEQASLRYFGLIRIGTYT